MSDTVFPNTDGYQFGYVWENGLTITVISECGNPVAGRDMVVEIGGFGDAAPPGSAQCEVEFDNEGGVSRPNSPTDPPALEVEVTMRPTSTLDEAGAEEGTATVSPSAAVPSAVPESPTQAQPEAVTAAPTELGTMAPTLQPSSALTEATTTLTTSFAEPEETVAPTTVVSQAETTDQNIVTASQAVEEVEENDNDDIRGPLDDVSNEDVTSTDEVNDGYDDVGGTIVAPKPSGDEDGGNGMQIPSGNDLQTNPSAAMEAQEGSGIQVAEEQEAPVLETKSGSRTCFTCGALAKSAAAGALLAMLL